MPPKKAHILVADDDRSLSEILVNILEYAGYRSTVVHSGQSALNRLKEQDTDLILLDLKLPDMNGTRILEWIQQQSLSIPVIMISGQGSIHSALECVRLGAYDFLEKPLDSERVLLTVKNALEKIRLERTRLRFMKNFEEQYRMVGRSPAMAEVHELISRAAATDSKVLIEGENGTGKELVARAIYIKSSRVDHDFVAVNCAAIPETLIESELFGHKRGAFTGAVADKTGRFRQADHGTLFLDEIGDMSIMTQAKVLRVLQEGAFEMVGDTETQHTDVRVIAATNKILHEEMKAGRFREDLYFRLNVLNIKLPPLRRRKEDIPLLVSHFIDYYCREYGVPPRSADRSGLEALSRYSWPGNIRELRNFVEKLVVLVDAPVITGDHIRERLDPYNRLPENDSGRENPTLKQAKDDFERDFIRERLEENGWNITRAAEQMDIPRTYLHKKIRKYHLNLRTPRQG